MPKFSSLCGAADPIRDLVIGYVDLETNFPVPLLYALARSEDVGPQMLPQL
jgi:hypothetical protein